MPLIEKFPPKACHDYTDGELIALILVGGLASERALDCLYKLYIGLARQSMEHHRLDRSTVLEAYHNALLALRDKVNAGKYRADGPLKAFFAIIFKFKCIDELRRATTKKKTDDSELHRMLEQELATLTPEERLLGEEDLQSEGRRNDRRAHCMDKALQPFNPRDRNLLVDYFILEMALTDLAEKYRLKKKAASTILSSLKKKLKDHIELLCQTDPACRLLCPDAPTTTKSL